MFKLNQSESFFWPVEILIPGDGGKFEKQTFDAQFKRKTQEDLLGLRSRIEAGELTDAGFAREVLLGWKGISENGEDVPFSETTLEQVLNVPNVATAIVVAFVNAHAGVARKN